MAKKPSHQQQRRYIKYFAASIKKHPNWPVLISEGDSWFSFPAHRNTVTHLDEMAGRKLSLLRLEGSGDELLTIMGGKQKEKLRRCLDRYPVQALLFSGGGNDVVGTHLLQILRRKTGGMNWEQCIRKSRATSRIAQLRGAYVDLLDLRDDVRPDCRIYVHGYDYAIPTGKKAKYLIFKAGPWLKPYLEAMAIQDPVDQRRVVRWLIDRFNEMLDDLARQRSNFVHVKTRRTLKAGEWKDELHPTTQGFKKVADKFAAKLNKQFPGVF